jgi:ubiquitin-conjugating enzyme E2 Q
MRVQQVEDMKRHLERKVKAGKARPMLKDLDPTVLPAAWALLRWRVDRRSQYSLVSPFDRCIASCTAYIEDVTEGDEVITDIGKLAELFPTIQPS